MFRTLDLICYEEDEEIPHSPPPLLQEASVEEAAALLVRFQLLMFSISFFVSIHVMCFLGVSV